MRLTVLSCGCAILAAATASAQAPPTFKHIVIVVQENRTPDNLFGSNASFEPGVDIATTGTTSHHTTVTLTPVPLAGCYDLSHSHASFQTELMKGFDLERADGPDCSGQPPTNLAYHYADNSTGVVQPYFDIAANYGFANRMFQTNQGPSFPAHQFLFSGTSAPIPNSNLFAAENMKIPTGPASGNSSGCIAPLKQRVVLIDAAGSETRNRALYPCFDRATLSDLLDAANPPLPWRYYAPSPGSIWTAPAAVRHICQPAIIGKTLTCSSAEWNASVVANNPAQVLTDIQACNLAAVSWVMPTGEESDHAAINKGTGPQWVASIVNAVGTQTCPSGEKYWADTVILVTWDDWGGWFDHVKPFQVNFDQVKWGSGYTYGFRVPLLVVSAFTPAHLVSNDILDFGSILYFVEQNFKLGFIGPGPGKFTQYADYQASQTPFGTLAPFFTLATPKAFTPIATKMTAKDFILAPHSDLPPDND